MGTATLDRQTRTQAREALPARAVDEWRLAHLVAVLSGCSMERGRDLVQGSADDDPLTTVARCLAATLPRPKARVSNG
jgi:hypothetical protein